MIASVCFWVKPGKRRQAESGVQKQKNIYHDQRENRDGTPQLKIIEARNQRVQRRARLGAKVAKSQKSAERRIEARKEVYAEETSLGKEKPRQKASRRSVKLG